MNLITAGWILARVRQEEVILAAKQAARRGRGETSSGGAAVSLWQMFEKLLEAWFIIRTSLKAQGHSNADIAVIALDATNGTELARQVVVRGIPLA